VSSSDLELRCRLRQDLPDKDLPMPTAGMCFAAIVGLPRASRSGQPCQAPLDPLLINVI
jgi:hypothetical protein